MKIYDCDQEWVEVAKPSRQDPSGTVAILETKEDVVYLTAMHARALAEELTRMANEPTEDEKAARRAYEAYTKETNGADIVHPDQAWDRLVFIDFRSGSRFKARWIAAAKAARGDK